MKIANLKYVIPLMLNILFGFDCAYPQSAQSKPILLANLSCMANRGYLWESEIEEVVLNREIYTSQMATTSSHNGRRRYDSEFSCKLPNAKSAELDLEMGIPSNAKGPILLSFYLNGNQIYSEKIFSGRITSVKIPLTGRTDGIAYQVGGRRTLTAEHTCLNPDDCGRLRFFKANLNVVGNPGGKP